VAVTTCTVAVGVLVGDPPKTCGWVAKKAMARIATMRTARSAGSSQRRFGF
jgi:hypothetical protein